MASISETKSAEAREITTLNADYFSQIIPEPPTVCGLRLKPLSIGRYRLMARFNVAFASDSEVEASAGDLLMGAIICSMSCDDLVEFAAHPKFRQRVLAWGRRFGFFPPRYLSFPIIGGVIKKIAGAEIAYADADYLKKQISIFQKYITDGAPDVSKRFWNEPSDPSANGAHWSQSIESVLREFQGWTKREIDEEPLTKALWDFYKHLENRGLGRFLSPEEQAQMEVKLTPEQIAESKEKSEKLREFLKKKGRING